MPDVSRLLGEACPHAGQAWQQVLVLGELHLELSFARVRVLGEDVEDQPGAVDDADALPECRFQLLLLPGGKLVVEEHAARIIGGAELLDLLHLAGADPGPRVGTLELLPGGPRDLQACRGGKTPQFSERVFNGPRRRRPLQLDADENGAAIVCGGSRAAVPRGTDAFLRNQVFEHYCSKILLSGRHCEPRAPPRRPRGKQIEAPGEAIDVEHLSAEEEPGNQAGPHRPRIHLGEDDAPCRDHLVAFFRVDHGEGQPIEQRRYSLPLLPAELRAGQERIDAGKGEDRLGKGPRHELTDGRNELLSGACAARVDEGCLDIGRPEVGQRRNL